MPIEGPARLVLAAAGLLACGVLPARAAGPALAVDSTPVTVKASSACFSDNVRVTGWLIPRQETVVSFGADGFRISDVLAREGDVVGPDQEMARLTRLPDPANPRPGPSTISVRAPAAGIISRSTARVGALTSPQADPLFRLVTDPDLDLLVEVPSLHASRVKAGASARILLDNGAEATGTVRVPASEIDPATQFGRARLSVQSDRPLRFGTFARALIDTGRSCGVAVPRSAIVRQNDQTSVLVMRDGRMESRRVRIGLSSEDSVEIREGLADGDAVVTNAGLAF